MEGRKVSYDDSLIGSNVIVGSSWGKVLRHCNSWGENVITPKKIRKYWENEIMGCLCLCHCQNNLINGPFII
jgi:hypothetical protein